jgi:hypothetical protein
MPPYHSDAASKAKPALHNQRISSLHVSVMSLSSGAMVGLHRDAIGWRHDGSSVANTSGIAWQRRNLTGTVLAT